MKLRMIAILITVAVFGVGSVEATFCARDPVPAATLLFPFVVYDYNNPTTGMNSVLQIINTGSAAQIVSVRVWSDTGLLVLGFNVVLSGYDVQTISMRDVLFDGVLPVTGTSGAQIVSGSAVEAGPVDAVPDLAQPEGTDALSDRCSFVFQGYPFPDPIPGSSLFQIQQALQQSQLTVRQHNDCVSPTGYPISDWFEGRTTTDPTWMYVTADVVWTCARHLPGTAAYWQHGPTANPSFDPNGAQRLDDNVLTGNVVWIDQASGTSESMLAVHVEADESLGSGTPLQPVRNPISGSWQSFYHFDSSLHGVSDAREPLPTAWAFRWQDDDVDRNTAVRIWKAPGSSSDLEFAAGSTISPTDPWVRPDYTFSPTMEARDCLAYTYYAWDEDESVTTGSIEPNLLPLRTQEVDLDNFSLPGDAGWMQVLWPGSNGAESDLYQTWMGVRQMWSGGDSTSRPALVMDNFNCEGWLYASGFELGSTAGWHGTSP